MKFFDEKPTLTPAAVEPAEDESFDILDANKKDLLRRVDFSGMKLSKPVQRVIDQLQQESDLNLDAPLGESSNAGFSFPMVKYSQLKGEERIAANKILREIALSADDGNQVTTVGPKLQKEINESAEFMNGLFEKLANKVKAGLAEEGVVPSQPEPVNTPEPVREAAPVQQTITQASFTSPAEIPDPEITDVDKQRFVISVLTNEPYSETISLFNGSMVVTYKALSAQTIDMIACALSVITEDKTIPPFLKTSFVVKYSLAAQISEITIKGHSLTLPTLTPTNDLSDLSDQFLARYNAITKSISNVVIITAITDNMTLFNKKCQILAAKAFDENFWKPTQ
jgi:hypothetical protein